MTSCAALGPMETATTLDVRRGGAHTHLAGDVLLAQAHGLLDRDLAKGVHAHLDARQVHRCRASVRATHAPFFSAFTRILAA